MEVVREHAPVTPGSPKQRALLIDLLLHHGETVSRDRLIDDLWPEAPPTTAAGVLQNYVSQLRRALGADAVRTNGPGYEIVLDGHQLDIVEFEQLVKQARAAHAAGDMPAVVEQTRQALSLCRGQPLADVTFEPFAQGEIARLREQRAAIVELKLEAELASGHPDQAVAGLEAALTEDPLREHLWWLLMLALHRCGRQAEALRAYQRARSVLTEELGLDPGAELRDLERAILEQREDLKQLLRLPAPRATRLRAPTRTPLVGRTSEWAAVAQVLQENRATEARLLLFLGEAGIGKTRLLEEAHEHAEATGNTVIAGRAFEAERGRPYGFWVDALRSVELPTLPSSVRADLAPLLPELSDVRVDLDDPNRLYDSVVAVVDLLSRRAPVAVLLDDVHWLDEPSAALLHFAIRHLGGRPVKFLATARPAELDDNIACTRLIQALRRDDALRELWVGPLEPATIGELTAPIAPGADASRIAAVSGGNALFALEIARALARGDDPLSSRLDALIGDRLRRLGQDANALVPWVAAFGRSIKPSLLARIVDRDQGRLFEPLGELERHGVLRGTEDGTYDFTHDLVRAAAYKRVSTPRRAMVHARIGTVLVKLADPDDGLAADAARHADAGGDSATCATACVRAAQRCLRLLAYPEADEHVALGRRHARLLAPEQRVQLELQLMHVLLHPGMRLHDPGELARELAELCADAQQLRLDAELSTGLVLLGRAYHWGWGDIPRARALLQRSVQVIESMKEPNIEPLLESARCLAYLEIDMERTYELFQQLGALHNLAETSYQYQWGAGLVRAWADELDEARSALGRAIELATARSDHWATFECTARLALVEIEAGMPEAAATHCERLEPLAAKLGEGSERGYARAIAALHALTLREPGAEMRFNEALTELERIDARFLIPDLLGIAAEIEHHSGNPKAASARAARSLEVSVEAARPLEAMRAQAVLACVAAANGALDEARSHLQAGPRGPGRLPGHVEALRRQAERLIKAGRQRWEETSGRNHGGRAL